MEFRIMGALEVRDGTSNRTPTAAKHRDLLAVLVLNARRPMTVARLRQLLWPHEDGERSDSLVRGYVGQLRRLLGKDVITTVSGTYTLAVDADQVDVERFRRLVERGVTGSGDQGRASLSEALALWRGLVFEDVDPDGTRWRETARLREEMEELRLLVVERRIDLDLEEGRHRQVIGELRRLVGQHPLWQRFRGQCMLALYRSGRRVEALEMYHGLREVLDEGHAIAPDPELQHLYHRMLHDDVSLHVSVGPPVLVPHDVSDFTGRQDLLGILDEAMLDGARIVIHGQAGAGKSALAVHAAWRHKERFPDGILYADLRGESSAPAMVVQDFLRWLGCPAQTIPAGADQRQQLLRAYTANRRLLVLLDNVSDEEQARPLLTSCATVITSRSTLGGLTDAARLHVGVLDDDAGVDLLVRLVGAERAKADPRATERLARFCGGLPIALRIAGSRLAARPSWTVDHLVRLLEDEHGRLDHLHSGDQTVRSVYSIGYEGLPEPARRALRLLAAHSAPDLADWVAELFGAQAEALVEAGLLETHVVDVAGQLRYRLHDLTRLYARERLLEEEGIRRPLADLLALVTTRVRASRFPLVSGDPAVARPFATTDIRQSVEWLLAERAFLVHLIADLHEAELWDGAWRLAHLLTPFFERHRFLDDWNATVELALDAARRAGDPRGEALVLRDQGDLHRAERKWDRAQDRLKVALGMFLRQGRASDAAHTRRRLGSVYLEQGRLADAERSLTASLAAFGDDARGSADARGALGAVLRRAGRLDEAATQLETATALLADLGDRHRRADALLDLAAVRLSQHRIADARQSSQEARGIAIRLGDRLLDARSLMTLAEVSLAEGASGRARELAEDALKIFDAFGDQHGRARAAHVLDQAG